MSHSKAQGSSRRIRGESSSSNPSMKRAMLIGLKYEQPKMQYANDDCIKIKDLLINRFQFPENTIRLLLDERKVVGKLATLSSRYLEKMIIKFIEGTKSGDISLLYISGHGSRSEEAPHDVHLVGTDYKLVQVDRIKEAMNRLNKDNKFVVVIDVCFGGGFDEIYNENITMFLASKRTEESHGNAEIGSYFTNCFVDYMEKYPTIESEQLIELLKEKLIQMGCPQTPRLLSNKDNAKSPVFTFKS